MLESCDTLDEFHQVCAPLDVHTGRRFIHFELDITNRCNIRCVMCYHSLESTRRAKLVHLQPEAFLAAAARVLPYAHRLSLSLGNEPLMSPHFVGILKVAAPYRVPNVNFYTNGLLLNDTNIDAMIAYGVTQVCVSIDGATRGTYNAIRRDGDFDQLVANVKRLLQRRNAAKRATPRVRFDIVMMQRNIHELDDLVELAAELGVQEVNFRHLVSFRDLGMEHESLKNLKALSNYWLDRALATATARGLAVHHHPVPFDLEENGASAETLARSPFVSTPYCKYPFYFVTMGPNGDVLPCPHGHGEAAYGRVSPDMPLDRIWLGPKFTALRERILAHHPPDMCRRCPWLGDRYPNVNELFATRTP